MLTANIKKLTSLIQSVESLETRRNVGRHIELEGEVESF